MSVTIEVMFLMDILHVINVDVDVAHVGVKIAIAFVKDLSMVMFVTLEVVVNMDALPAFLIVDVKIVHVGAKMAIVLAKGGINLDFHVYDFFLSLRKKLL